MEFFVCEIALVFYFFSVTLSLHAIFKTKNLSRI